MEDPIVGRVEPEYTIGVVVARTGVSANTIRSWERRYNFPRPGRDATNQRLYSDVDVRAILWLKQQRSLGWSPADAINRLHERAILPTDMPSGHSPAVVDAPSTRHHDAIGEVTRTSLSQAVAVFDEETARRSIYDAMTVTPIEDVCFSILLPLERKADEAGASGLFTINFVRQILFTLYNASNPAFGHSTILLAGISNTRSECHLLCHAVNASRSGYRTILLGTDIPMNQVETCVAKIQPQALMMTAETEHAAWVLGRLYHRLDHDAPIAGWNGTLLFGGSIFAERPELASDVENVLLPDDPSAARDKMGGAMSASTAGLRIVGPS